MSAPPPRFRGAARIFVGNAFSGSARSPGGGVACSKSRTTSSDHLSPKTSSELAIAQRERAKGFTVFIERVFLALKQVTCRVQVIVLRSVETCKMQVTKGEGYDDDSFASIRQLSAGRAGRCSLGRGGRLRPLVSAHPGIGRRWRICRPPRDTPAPD